MLKLFDNLLDLIFPPRCEVCKKLGTVTLCPSCFGQIKFMKPHMGIYSASIYEGVLRTAIHRFKFDRRKGLASPLGVMLVQYLSQVEGMDFKALDVIIPVPLHHLRLRQRGFNQSEVLARSFGKYYETPVVGALERVRDTKAQFDLPREERFHNIAGAFKVADSKAVYNKRIMLFDDIYTTGATIAECSKVLKNAGAKKVEVLTLSRAI